MVTQCLITHIGLTLQRYFYLKPDIQCLECATDVYCKCLTLHFAVSLSLMRIHSSPVVTLSRNHPCLAQSEGYNESIASLIPCWSSISTRTTAPLLSQLSETCSHRHLNYSLWFAVCMCRATRFIASTAVQQRIIYCEELNTNECFSVFRRKKPFP